MSKNTNSTKNLTEPQVDAVTLDCYTVGDQLYALTDQWDWDTGVTYIKVGDSLTVVEVGSESLRVSVPSGRLFTIWKRDVRR